MYISNANLPEQNVKKVIVDYRVNEDILEGLDTLGITALKTFKNKNVNPAMDGHADMQICHVGGNKVVCTPEVYEYYKSVLPDFEVVLGSTILKSNYPSDIAYNITCVGNKLIHNFKYTDSKIKEIFLGNIKINVKQGYSKCTTCVVDADAIITSDCGIYQGAKRYGMQALLISNGAISLSGFEYGFIGGASGLVSNEKLAFCGDISKHPDVVDIQKFCFKFGVEIVSLSKGELVDIGSIIPILE